MKIVVSRCYGGFGLSQKAHEFLGIAWDEYGTVDSLPRNDPKLVECVETLGVAANGTCAELVVVEIPDGVEWEVKEYDGSEWVAEKHRTW